MLGVSMKTYITSSGICAARGRRRCGNEFEDKPRSGNHQPGLGDGGAVAGSVSQFVAAILSSSMDTKRAGGEEDRYALQLALANGLKASRWIRTTRRSCASDRGSDPATTRR